jgi:diguanylate cyclase (GGDEF)-like protein/PAS domain S-box-containing protein
MTDESKPPTQAAAPPTAAPAEPAIRVLQLEDNAADAELIDRRLASDGLDTQCRVVANEREFRLALAEFAPEIVLSDFSLHGFDGLTALEIARELAPTTPFIFVSGTIGEERAIEALKRGATDYVLKDNLRRLVPAVRSALRQAKIAQAKDLAEDMLKRSESRLQDIVNTSRDWIWECDRVGRFTFSSPSVSHVLGYTRHEVLGRAATDFVDATDELRLQATLSQAAANDDPEARVTLRWRHKNGQPRWLERSMVSLRDAGGNWTGVRGIDRDVSLRVAQEVRIRRLNRALRFLSGASSAGMRIRDRKQLAREACRLAVSVGGYVRASIYLFPNEKSGIPPLACSYGGAHADGTKWIVGTKLPQGVSPVTQALATAAPVVLNDLGDPAIAGLLSREEPPQPPDARSRIALPLLVDRATIGVIDLCAADTGVFGEAEVALLKQVAANVTFAMQYLRSKENEEFLEYFDSLTGLANRALYLQRVAAALAAASREASQLEMAVVDISDLGIINDSLGHHAGDVLLRLVAERLLLEFRDPQILCRLIGDRFSVMHSDRNDDYDLVERIAACFDAPFSVNGHELRVSIRIGVGQHPEDGDNAESLLQAAGIALQQAKKTSVRDLRYRASMNATTSRRFALTNELRSAAAEKTFTLHYQPKLDLRTGAIQGVEALLRWQGSQGSVPPNIFVPMLESLGLIHEVGSWVITRAVTETADWTVGEEFRVAVNVSPLQLNREDFADRALEAIDDLGVDPHRLELEVTESSLMSDPSRASASLSRLREVGVSIAIDDFGTGHSSLAILAGLPIDVLKIDGSFVRDFAENRNHRLIVQTTIGLAASLGLKTVAEGVETIEQLEWLKGAGCDIAQGYLVRRPAAAQELTAWFAGDTLQKLRRLVVPDRHEMPRKSLGARHRDV